MNGFIAALDAVADEDVRPLSRASVRLADALCDELAKDT
jgi:hypothetical protein